ncbi:MAG: LCP family protein [Nocardioides sp.]|nr:LCP family protein [Nocardioides sp.]
MHDEQSPAPRRGSRTQSGSPAASRRTRRRHWVRRHKALTVLVSTAVALGVSVVGWAVYLNAQLDHIDRFDIGLARTDRPPRTPGDAVNILLLGVDDPDHQPDVGPRLEEILDDGDWVPGAFRSDTMMVVHLNADGDEAQLVSIPRDSWVDVPGHGMHKINAALSLGGPELAAEAVEDNFGIYLDHVMLVDFEGFRNVTDTLGGVDVQIPETVVNPLNNQTWTKGTHHLRGEEALLYVRQRYGLPGGDFDRIQRQQNFLRAVMDKAVRADLLLNPLKVKSLVDDVTGLLAVDSSLTNARLRRLLFSARGLRSSNIRFLTIPNDGSGRVGSASVVEVRLDEARSMFSAIEHDRFEGWYADHDVRMLSGRSNVD